VAVAVVGACFVVNAVLALLLTSFVWSRRRGGAGTALAAVLVSTALWSAAYAGELVTTGATSLLWGDLKYVGIGALVPSFVAFVLCWIGRGRLVTPRTLAALAVEPVAVLVLLAVPATHDLVRSLDPASEPGVPAVALSGPAFWVHLVYTNVLLVGSVVVFVTSLLRRSRHYQGEAWALVAAALLPFVVNLGFNLGIGPLAAVDLTPISFTISAAVLARALLERRLLRLAPIAFGTVVRGMTEGVLVLDDGCRVVEANPAGLAMLGWTSRWRGRDLPDVLREVAQRDDGVHETRFDAGAGAVDLEIQVSDLPDARGHAGRLLVVRDITRRRAEEQRRDRALRDQARVAATLSRSLRPSELPDVPGVGLGAVYRPAGAGREVGGDFYDVFAVGDRWAFAIGDVSGKGATSAAITAMARYTLRALVQPGDAPSAALAGLNRHMVDDTEDETYLTVATGVLDTTGVPDGVEVQLALGGHAQPLLLPADGPVRPVGVPGGAIGLFAEIDLADCPVHLGAGDALVLFTDGVTEARGAEGLFGEQRLVELLEDARGLDAEGVAARVADAVLRFQDDDAADDIAVLVITVPRPADAVQA
jgi:sigma-B regulation protein RsbU (phosphoserine phosphatase)